MTLKSTFNMSVTPYTLGVSNMPKSPLISDEARLMFQIVNFVILCSTICLLGIVTNIINIIVFYRQGFKESMNISFLGLAITDLGVVLTTLWTSLCYNPLFARAGLPFDELDMMYLTGGVPHVYLNRVTTFITAFITLERCLCITMPLKVRTIFTPTRTSIIIVSIFIAVLISISPFCYVNKLEWTFDPPRNRTLFKLAYVENGEEMERVTFFVHSVAMAALPFSCVVVCTVILIAKLNKKTKWRQSAVAQPVSKSSTDVSVKDVKAVRMVALISTIFIICFIPAAVIVFIMGVEPEFTFKGQYFNAWIVAWSFATVLEVINSSVNFFVYLKMSSKFRLTFIQTFQ